VILTKAQNSSGAMVALYPSPEVAQQLAVADGEPAADLHLTLAFLGEASAVENPERLAQVVQGVALSTPPLSGEVSGVGHFTAGEDPVTYASPEVPGLSEFRHRIVEALEGAGYEPSQEHGFTPHLTLAYDHIEPDVPNLPLDFGEVCVCLGGERQSFPLDGVAKAEASRLRRAVDAITRARKSDPPDASWDGDHRQLTVPLWKDDAKRIVYGVVMQPHVPDSQGDWQSEEDIEAAAHRYLAESRKHDVQHAEEQVAVTPVESFIAPADMEYAGRPILKGSWVMAVRVDDEAVWQQVCNEELTGFSIGGTGMRHE
jgi:2'-5' RNA ligase